LEVLFAGICSTKKQVPIFPSHHSPQRLTYPVPIFEQTKQLLEQRLAFLILKQALMAVEK
jgi:hypothetical protein